MLFYMTSVLFQSSTKPCGHFIKISDEEIKISIGDDPSKLTIKVIIYLMSKVISSDIYISNTVNIQLIETLPIHLIETQIRAFFFFTYKQLSYKTNANNNDSVKFTLSHSGSHGELIKKNEIICSTINEIKTLIEMPPELVYPETLLKYVLDFSERNNLKVLEVYDEVRLEKEGFGGVLSVGRGSHNPPRMAILEYPGLGSNSVRSNSGKTNNSKTNNTKKPIVLVGKGITYDSGGYSIKTDDYMKDMKRDKTGVCIVLGIMGLLSKLKCKQRVIAILPMAENVVSSKSYKPDEIIRSYSKKTVEVFNTDAEGRLLLMDGLAKGREYDPKMMFDVATLTSVGVFCGKYGALFTNNNKVAWEVQQMGDQVGDRYWVLPIADEFITDSKNSKIANVKNDGYKCYSTTTMGASFLSNFVTDDIPWVHVDLGESESLYEKYNVNNLNSTNGLLMLCEYIMKL